MRMLHRYYYTSSNAAKDSQGGTAVSTIRTLPCIHEKAFSRASLRKDSKVNLSDGTTTAPFQEWVISNPPASIYAGCCGDGDNEDETKNTMEIHSDDSDTCSEMTLSATFSNSSFMTTTSSSNKLKEVSPASNTVAANTSISGKMMGLTLQETMEWRRRVSVSSTIGHGDDARNCNFSSCAVLPQPSRGGESWRHCSDKERKTVCRDQPSSNKGSDEKCPPEFMTVRAKLKSAKSTRRNRFVSVGVGGSACVGRMSGDVTMTQKGSPSIAANSNSSRISDNSNGSSSSRGRSSSTTIISGKEMKLGNTISAMQPMETSQSNVQSTIVTVEDSAKTCQGTKCVQDKDIHQKLKALFANRQTHVVAESKKNTIQSVAANSKVDVDNDAIHNDGNTSSKSIALDCNKGKGVTNFIKSDFKSKLNEVFSQRIPSKHVNKNHLVKERTIVRDTLEQRMVEMDGLEQVRDHNTHRKDTVSMKHLKELTRTTSTGVESRDDNAAQDVNEDVRDSEPQVANCEKYQKMLKLGLPEAAVRHAMIKDGVNPSLLFADDTSHQRSFCADNNSKKDPFRRIRLHWDTIPEENVSQGCIWHEIKLDTDIGNLNIEEQEFNKLFQCEVLSLSVLSPRNECSTERVVKVIDPKRANNGGIILARLKMSYEDIAISIATMNDSVLTPQQIIGIMEYIPTEDERKSLGNYMSSGRDSSTLCECEKFMLAIMPVQAAKKKLEAMLFKLQYPNSVKQLYQDIDTLSKACDNILESVKLRKTLGVILKVGNRLNLAGMESIKTSASGFTIELLTKLNQVRALDRTTTILQYIVSVIERWNAPLLHIKEELKYVLRTKKIADYESSLHSLENQLNNFVRTAALVEDHDETCADTGTNPKNLNESTAIGQFVLDATETIYDLQKKHAVFKEKFNDVLIYLAQDKSTKPDKLFGAISVFCHELDTALHTNRNKHRYRKN